MLLEKEKITRSFTILLNSMPVKIVSLGMADLNMQPLKCNVKVSSKSFNCNVFQNSTNWELLVRRCARMTSTIMEQSYISVITISYKSLTYDKS